MTRRQVLLAAAVIVAAVAVGLVARTARSTPISRQSCTQLAHSQQRVDEQTGDISRTADEKRQTMQDAAAVNDRVDELGGCPQAILR